MSVTETIFNLIDMRSFRSLWYWIALAACWSMASHWVLGVPFDMVLRVRRKRADAGAGDEAGAQLVDMTRLHVARLLRFGRQGGIALAMVAGFALTSLALLGFQYRVEFAQAIFLILAPMTLVAVLSLRAAHRLEAPLAAGTLPPAALARALIRHRLKVQGVGMLAITVTAFWGMLQNLRIASFQ